MILREFFARLGLEVDEATFAAGGFALEAVKFGIQKVAEAAVAGARALEGMVLETAKTADEARKGAQSAGTTTEALLSLQYAASLADVSVEELQHGLVALTQRMSAAQKGSEETAKAFAGIGVKVTNSDGSLRNADAVLADVAAKFADMPDGARKTALAFELFGKAGTKLIPLLNGGATGLAELRKEAEDFGLVVGNDAAGNAERLNDGLTRLQASWEGIRRTVGSAIWYEVADAIESVVKQIKDNRQAFSRALTPVVRAFVAVTKGAVAVVLGLATGIAKLVENLDLLAVLLTSTVIVAVASNAAALWGLVTAYAATGASAVASGLAAAAAWIAAAAPVLATVAAIALLILILEDIWTWLQGGESLLKRVGEAFGEFLAKFVEPQEGDPWWLALLRTFVNEVLNLPATFDNAMAAIGRAFQSMIDALTAGVKKLGEVLTDWLVKPISKAGDMVSSALWRTIYGREPNQQIVDSLAQGGPLPNAAAMGGGASPAASAMVTNSPLLRPASTASTFDATFNITTAPGQSPTEVAAATRAAFDEWHEAKMGEAFAAAGGG